MISEEIRRIETQRHVLEGELAVDREVPGEVQRSIAVIHRIGGIDRPVACQVLIRPFTMDGTTGLRLCCRKSRRGYEKGAGE